jgi:tetratricopeptide (TPR) repeat protein
VNFGLPTKSAKGIAELDPVAEFRQGVTLLKNGYFKEALGCLRHAFESDRHNPYYLSFLGLSIARAERNWDQASELCEIAVQLRPREIQFHLNLADVYACAGLRVKALDTLDAALELFGEDGRLKRAHSHVEKRRSPVIPFFTRDHFLNRQLGKLGTAHRNAKAKEKV